MSKRAARVHETPGYVLHATAWRETSLIVQAFSRDHGWVSMVAKGAKRPHSMLRPALSVFQPLLLSWSGATEVKTMTRADDEACRIFVASFAPTVSAAIPQPGELSRGGIVGETTILDCVSSHSSDWFVGSWGFVLDESYPLPFVPCPGRLGFFDL